MTQEKAHKVLLEVFKEFPFEVRDGWKLMWDERHYGMNWKKREIYFLLRLSRLKTRKMKRCFRESIANAIFYEPYDYRRKQMSWAEFNSIKPTDYAR